MYQTFSVKDGICKTELVNPIQPESSSDDGGSGDEGGKDYNSIICSFNTFEQFCKWKKSEDCKAFINSDEYMSQQSERHILSLLRSGGGGGTSGILTWYEITITQPDTDKSPKRLCSVFERIVNSKSVGALQYKGVLELTESGTPHIHILIGTSLSPTAFIRKRDLEKLNDGFRVSRDKVRKVLNFQTYLDKDLKCPTRKAYLDLHKIEGYWVKI